MPIADLRSPHRHSRKPIACDGHTLGFAHPTSWLNTPDQRETMPAISMFYGLIVYMYFMDNRQHQLPHIHVRYQDDEVVVSIPGGDVLDGTIPPAKMKLLQAWIELHKDELMADWSLAVSGQQPYKIEPLR